MTVGEYAIVEKGIVTNVVVWGGDTQVWTPPDGAIAVEYFDGDAVGIGCAYDGTVFTARPAPLVPPPTPAEIQAANARMRDTLLSNAALAIAPLQDAVDLEDATPIEIARLTLWKQHRVAVNRIDLTIAEPTWPIAPA